MKNDRTPRTSAECQFTVGYPTIPRRRPPIDWSTWVIAALAAGVLLGIYFGAL